jgi:hypothetical protein
VQSVIKHNNQQPRVPRSDRGPLTQLLTAMQPNRNQARAPNRPKRASALTLPKPGASK